ncbi:GNAT family N-acetyltransferase [Nocardiopsis aegyptia]|uniref:GNAT family N-acetyltransferase n=1 Tax=Nocardiopsis aegyptia TaxID=220378 RepID=UPI00366D0B76
MVPPDVFREQPVLTGGRVRLEPLDGENGAALVDDYVDMDPVVRRLTGTHQRFTPEVLRDWFATRPDQHDRADWAILEREGGMVVGECALLDLDPENAAADYRISLRDMALTGRGYGTEATDLVLDYAFGTAGLHRVALQVFAFNVNAQKSYARSGFVREGVWRSHLRWDGRWHDTVLMSVLAEEHARRRVERGADT